MTEPEDRRTRHVLVAVDNDEASERVSEFVNDFFAPMGCEITAVNVSGAPRHWGPYAIQPGAVYPWSYAPAMPVGAVSAPLGPGEAEGEAIAASGLEADDEVVEPGLDVPDTLRWVAAQREVDLLVVGNTHKGFLDRLFSPSVSRDLAKSSPIPVLIVH